MNHSAGGSAPGHRVDVEIRWAANHLSAAGVESPRVDAEWLLADALGVDRGRLLLVDAVPDDVRARFRRAVAQRAERIPLQHITGTAAFGPAELAVGPGVFTPRPETEFLAQWAVAALSGGSVTHVVDLCSGSGALAIAVALLVPSVRVTAVERSPQAVEWLSRNVDEAGADVAGRVSVVRADVTDAELMRELIVPATVDVVVANPPYVPEGSTISPEVTHDPHDAVFGGADGMAVIVPMLPVIAEMLRPGGLVGIEHDETTSVSVLTAMASTGQFVDVRAHDDLTGRPRFATARRADGRACDTRGKMAG
ncbi:peptide chain release factor N(5)-glutamine methyltransferase [Gordonia sp. HNM0687]|uniref:Release factor glutamine methyltransferase n=1 Tax=Gordonia mangrovi TaxID=2665643 RepID=A0A6L7GUD0_9ACTN|nr:peptide chain release factor N(5)-glutamine methyltransferase [Gordonia mangrovi]MXP23193.1 peptide chain release factor N(5)-glutamine methyltransferase [Gordonia mangrovi]UVF77467.1 peptide chain release factor N(5)-glutamine methyltransferase [Gordonia mangrovi]